MSATRSARVALVALAAAVPLFTTRLVGAAPLTHDTWVLPKLVLAWMLLAFALAAWGLALLRGQTRLRWHSALLPLALAVTWSALSAALSPASATVSLLGAHARADGVVPFAVYAVLAALALQLHEDTRHTRALVRAVVVSGLAVSLVALAQWFGADPFFYLGAVQMAGRSFGTFGNPVFLGGYLAMLLPPALALGLAEERWPWRLLGWLGTAASLGALLATYSRGAWLAAIAGGAVFAALAVRAHTRAGRRTGIAVGVAALLGIVAGWVGALRPGAPDLAARVVSALDLTRGSAGERVLIWRAALDAIRERPVFGFGPGRFQAAFQLEQPFEHVERFGGTVAIDQAHNTPLHLAATAGVVAAASWVVFVGWVLVDAVRATGRRRGMRPGAGATEVAVEEASPLWQAALAASVAGYAVFSLTGVPTPGVEVVFYLFAGVLLGPRAREIAIGPGPARVAVRAVAVVLTVLVVALAAWGVVLLGADRAYLESRMRMRGDATGDPVPPAERAARLAAVDPYYRVGLAYALTSEPEGDPVRAIRELDSVLAQEPAYIDAYLEKASLQAAADDVTGASETLRRASGFAPNSPWVASARSQLGPAVLE